MADRRPLVLLIAAGAVALFATGLIAGFQPLVAGGESDGGVRDLGMLALVLAGGLAVAALFMVEPAWPLSLSVVMMAFSGNWALLDSPVALDRVLLVVGLVSLLVRARSPRDLFGREPSVSHAVVVIAALYGVGSLAFSGALGDHEATFALLDRFGLVPFVLFAVAPAAFPDTRSRKILLGCLTALGAYLVYVSLLSRLGPESLVWPGYIVDPAVGIHADRARGPFVEAGANGLALFECGVAAAVLSSYHLDRRVRWAILAVAMGCLLCIVLTLTRSVWIGSAVGLVAAVVMIPATRRLLVPLAAATVAGVALMLAVVPGLADDVKERNTDDRPVWDRKNANTAALRMVAERPLVGFGWDTFSVENSEYQQLSDEHIITRADLVQHNVFLSNAVELGLLGTLLWGAALAIAVGGALLTRGPPEFEWWRVGLFAIAAQWFVVANFVPLSYALPNALLWLWAGVIWAERGRDREECSAAASA